MNILAFEAAYLVIIDYGFLYIVFGDSGVNTRFTVCRSRARFTQRAIAIDSGCGKEEMVTIRIKNSGGMASERMAEVCMYLYIYVFTSRVLGEEKADF